MSEREDYDFSDLKIIEVPFKSPDGKRYVLREANGDVAAKYRNTLVKCTKLGPEGRPSGMEGIGELEPFLVSLCSFTVDEEPTKNNKPVSASIVRAWPSKMVKKLYAKAKEISELGEDDTIESLEKQIADLTKRLAKLRAETVPNVSDSTETTSD